MAPLSNAERQARYRERIKQLATHGVMTPVRAELLASTRVRLREWRREIVEMEAGYFRLYRGAGHVDVSAEYIGRLHQWIRENGALIAQYDPDDLTADGNIEIAANEPAQPQVRAGKPASYELDGRGEAMRLRIWPTDTAARSEAVRTPGRRAGRVGDDHWSIVPFDAED